MNWWNARRTLEDVELSHDAEDSDTVIDGTTVFLRYRIRTDAQENEPLVEHNVRIEVECPCCNGTGQMSTMCNFGCDHELECQSCDGGGWIPVRFEKGFDEEEDVFALDTEYFDDADVRIPLHVRRRFYYWTPFEDRDNCGHYVDPNQTSLFKEIP
jgi:hypothetical protein